MSLPVTVPVAFLAGAGSFFSPCVLPLVPSYLSALAGPAGGSPTAIHWQRRVIANASGFVLGLGMLLVASGLAATWVGAWLHRYQTEIAEVGGVLIILFGLHLVGAIDLPGLRREWRHWWGGRPQGGFWAAFGMGLAFGAGWTPCVGPVWASILVLAAQTRTAWEGGMLLAAYALGMGVPLLAMAGLVSAAARWVQRASRWTGWVERGAGALLVLLGIALLTGWYTHALNYLA
ncbi:MAG: cytochrome c biogenesis protein CcdA [Firmicutes bacterium]|nr:sulfite exporter TauE/SafE family protein [Alicyclobacillaceae bacterium]MCL6497466.1 cytochrome c biogenesis protein CcdA [Bacillota bacterium]